MVANLIVKNLIASQFEHKIDVFNRWKNIHVDGGVSEDSSYFHATVACGCGCMPWAIL